MPTPPGDAPKLDGKTALVTGAARRLGRAISVSLAERGANLAIHHHGSTDEAEALATSSRKIGVKARTFKADLDEPAQAEALFASVVREFGSVDLLINNASVFPEDRITDTDANPVIVIGTVFVVITTDGKYVKLEVIGFERFVDGKDVYDKYDIRLRSAIYEDPV